MLGDYYPNIFDVSWPNSLMVRENEQSKISVLGQYAQGFWRIDKFGKNSEKKFHLRN
jgi:hypothetical protein